MSFWNTIVGKIVKTAAKVVLPVVATITGIGAINAISAGIGAVSSAASNIAAGNSGANTVNGGGLSAISANATSIYSANGVTTVTTGTPLVGGESILKPLLIGGGLVGGLYLVSKLFKK